MWRREGCLDREIIHELIQNRVIRRLGQGHRTEIREQTTGKRDKSMAQTTTLAKQDKPEQVPQRLRLVDPETASKPIADA